jgi:hypothetical protein
MTAEDRDGSRSGTPTPVDHPLDELAEGLARGTLTRRRALRLAGAVLFGGALSAVPGMALAAPPEGRGRPCPKGEVKCRDACCGPEDRCCRGVCTNVSFDRFNCGACRNECAEGEDCCGSAGCVALDTHEHCGGCFSGCHEAEICVNGTCQCPDSGQTLCANVCCPQGHCVIDEETQSFVCA